MAPLLPLMGFKSATSLLVMLYALLSSTTEATARLPTAIAGRSLQQSASGLCVCTFDFDDTLRVYGPDGGHPADDADGILQACQVILYATLLLERSMAIQVMDAL